MNYTEYKPYVIDVGYLFSPSLADFLGDEDEVYIFREVTEQLDIGRLALHTIFIELTFQSLYRLLEFGNGCSSAADKLYSLIYR